MCLAHPKPYKNPPKTLIAYKAMFGVSGRRFRSAVARTRHNKGVWYIAHRSHSLDVTRSSAYSRGFHAYRSAVTARRNVFGGVGSDVVVKVLLRSLTHHGNSNSQVVALEMKILGVMK